MTRSPLCKHRAFTVAEALLALVVLSAVGVTAAQFAAWSLSERAKADARLDALDAAANAMEEARSRPWAELTPEWAAGKKLPDFAARLLRGELTARVDADELHPKLKRVTIEVRYANPDGTPAKPVTLIALFASRNAGGAP